MKTAKAKNNKKSGKKSIFNRMLYNNPLMFVLSLIFALVFWCGVSLFQTTEAEVSVPNVKIQLNLEDSMPIKNGLNLFGDTEYFVDVTVKGKSYIVNDSGFANFLSATVSLTSVSAPGTYTLPVSVSIRQYDESEVEITGLSKTNIALYFDEVTEKSFKVQAEINEQDGYKLADGYIRENPRLSAENVTLTGPSMELSKVASVKAVVELNKELKETEVFEAKIVPVGISENVTFPNVGIAEDTQIFVTVPVSFNTEFKTAVTFTGMPEVYKTDGVKYTVNPEKVTVSTADAQLIDAGEISVGTIDFAELNNVVNYITIPTKDLGYTINEEISAFKVTIDMSNMSKRWLEIKVMTDDVKLPEKASLASATIPSVQVIGPAESVMNIGADEVYAVPVLDGVELKPGVNTVPVKVILRTLTDSWVRNTYTVDIVVSE